MDSTPPPTGPARETRAKTFILEGEIAAGKSALAGTLADALRRRGHRVCVIFEPVDLWRGIGILSKFYGDPGRYGYGFQTFVFATRVLGIMRAVAAEPDADIYLLERSPATDKIFMALQKEVLDPVEMKMYHVWCSAYEYLLPLDLTKAKVLYLKTSLAQCMQRLAQRHREGEIVESEAKKTDATAVGGVSMEYQARLRRAHEAFFQGQRGLASEFPDLPASPFPLESVIEIPADLADGNFRDAGAERDRIIGAIIEKMAL